MPSEIPPEYGMPIDRGPFAAMIDKLVAVQIDLRTLCGGPDADSAALLTDGENQIIVEACAVLQSAIDDLKQVIFELEMVPTGEDASPTTDAHGAK